MNNLARDIRYSLRQLRRAPGFAVTAVLTLALGIGASSAIFCLIDGLWLHPLRVPHPGELVRVFATTKQSPAADEGVDTYFNYPEYQTIAARASGLKSVVALGRRGSLMQRQDGTAALLLTNVVSSNFFEALGVHPLLGRTFSSSDAANLRVHPAVLLGYGFWKREFSGDPNIVGRQISILRGKDHRTMVDVLGVLPASFREIDNGMDRDLWMSTDTWAAVAHADELTSLEFRWFKILGRLAPGATAAEVNQQVAAIAKGLELADPQANRGRGARAVGDFPYRMDRAGTTGLVLFAIVGCVVLLGTVNIAQIMLARALARAPEVALRLSLGARRGAVARQLLLENLLLGIFGLLAGLSLALAIAALLPKLLVSEPAMLVAIGSSQSSFQLDWRVFSFATVLALITMLLLALVPLSQVVRAELLPVLQSASTTRTGGKTPLLRRAAIWLQIAVSFALLISTGALVRSFINARTQSIGLTRNQVLLAWTQEPEAPMREEVLQRMKAMPGVDRVAYAVRSPLSLSEGGIEVKTTLPSHPEIHDPIGIKYNAVSPDFLDVIGTRILRGRGFVSSDDQPGPAVILINRTMAEKYWAGKDPVGQVVELVGFNTGSAPNTEARIIGVTEDAPINAIGELPEPYIYMPFHLSQLGEMTFALATRQNAMSLAQATRQVLIHTHPLLDPMMVTSLPELIRYSAGNYQMMAELVTALGFIGLVLTVVGLYGFLVFRVNQRRREIGIRMALGATREKTAMLILRDAARMAAFGLATGVVLALGATRLESSMLFGVHPIDALSIAFALAVLSLATFFAAWLPARRAASVDPVQALRTE
ncbi:MAG TPA: ADOP family duplicated permease [Terracidiphilus sp.]|jgi:predicted permease